MELREAIVPVFSIICLAVLVACFFCGFLDYADWRSTRLKKHTLMGKHRWAPAYWTRSFIARFAVKNGKKLRTLLVNLIVPIIKGFQLGIQSIKTIRAVFVDGEMWLSSAVQYSPGTHVTQVLCNSCSNQHLGLWLDRLPDSVTGEPLTNRPHQAVCLTCYNKMPKEKRALYSVSWTNFSNPYAEEEEMERDFNVPCERPMIHDPEVSFVIPTMPPIPEHWTSVER